jgi:hypothetical protein
MILLVRSLCHESFNGDEVFERHFVGEYGPTRRCRTPEEMEARGWALNSKGYWGKAKVEGDDWWKSLKERAAMNGESSL